MERFVLTLYVAGRRFWCGPLVERLERISRNALAGEYELRCVDCLQRPPLAGDEHVLAPDAVIRRLPVPLREPLAELVDAESGLVGLDLSRADPAGVREPAAFLPAGRDDASPSFSPRVAAMEAELQARTTELAQTRQELRQARQALVDHHRLALIGTMAAGIAHDINNPLSAVLMSAETAQRVMDDPAQAKMLHRCLANVVESSRQCGQLVKNLLKLARNETSERSIQDLNAIVRHAHGAVCSFLDRHQAKVQFSLAKNLPKISCNPLEIQAVVVNLLHNAVQASERPAKVSVRTEAIHRGIRLTVADRGHGVGQEEKQQLFDPLFSTRKGRGGTGLGLSICQTIVTAHGGTIEVDSQPGQGTTVTVTFPLEEAAGSHRPHVVRKKPPRRGCRASDTPSSREKVATGGDADEKYRNQL